MDQRLKNYPHAMTIDPETNKPMAKHAVQLTGSNVAQPTELQFRRSQPIQTHNAVNVGAGATALGAWIDASGFDRVGAVGVSSASHLMAFGIEWSVDGVNRRGTEPTLFGGTTQEPVFETAIKSRFFRVRFTNNDSVSRTFSADAYLKA